VAPRTAAELDRFDRVTELLESNAQLLTQYRELLQFGLAQLAAHFCSFDQHTHERMQGLSASVEKLTQAVTDFTRAADERLRRVEGAVDAIIPRVH
jgi:hypothetical protein